MRKTFAFLAFLGLASASATMPAADSLFSAVPIDSVFASPGGPTSTSTNTDRPYAPPPRVPAPSPNSPSPNGPSAGGPGSGAPNGGPNGGPNASSPLAPLVELFKQAGLEAKEIGDSALASKTQIESWSFPVIATLSDDQKQVYLVLLLSVVKDEKSIPVDKLLNLMSANRQYAPAYFSFSSKHKRTELYRSLNTADLTPDLLKDELAKLAGIAKETNALWNFASANPTTAPAAAPAAKAPIASTPNAAAPPAAAPNAAPPTATPSPLVGKWSAAPSDKEGFALLLTAEGKFTLVRVSQGKQTRSTGRYTHTNQQLTLQGEDGIQIAGTVVSATDQTFQFQLGSKTNKPATLAFKRAK